MTRNISCALIVQAEHGPGNISVPLSADGATRISQVARNSKRQGSNN